MEQTQAKFEGWAVLELMGHQREIGFVTTEYFGGAALFRVDRPEIPEREFELKRPQWAGGKYCEAGSKVKRPALEAKSRLISPGALYAINPLTEASARKLIDAEMERDLILLELKEPETPALPAAPQAENLCDDCQHGNHEACGDWECDCYDESHGELAGPPKRA